MNKSRVKLFGVTDHRHLFFKALRSVMDPDDKKFDLVMHL